MVLPKVFDTKTSTGIATLSAGSSLGYAGSLRPRKRPRQNTERGHPRPPGPQHELLAVASNSSAFSSRITTSPARKTLQA